MYDELFEFEDVDKNQKYDPNVDKTDGLASIKLETQSWSCIKPTNPTKAVGAVEYEDFPIGGSIVRVFSYNCTTKDGVYSMRFSTANGTIEDANGGIITPNTTKVVLLKVYCVSLPLCFIFYFFYTCNLSF